MAGKNYVSNTSYYARTIMDACYSINHFPRFNLLQLVICCMRLHVSPELDKLKQQRTVFKRVRYVHGNH